MSTRFIWFVRIDLLAALALAATAVSAALPGRAGTDFPGLVPRAQAELTWWGFDVYEARLWGAPGTPGAGGPYALEIEYRRSFTASQILASTRDELSRLEYPADRIDAWVDRLRDIIPDVNAGDRLIGVHLPDVGARFYSARRMLGSVDDPAFARAFFSIWLGPRGRLPVLREAWVGRR